ncbi:hypothetical protein A3A93_06475 [Candidatus Roizmanbacteria bacterium RIFCSPLOWO2_01_FULL_38_12]|uniref:Glycosyltransferase RgtA/B/C/D-like domain-containing protein n=1 Tax=Candidatus Roizmanbacteria bacterium RIFCSPLOWO2_01_FULL_38_12 TaxID=1802061 RepID=A0A1F7IU36_9BACT|nr:MAG: hypothetical protein A3A93_06475 [Candidatus Roizmanbacteria bacterium RIFCSPLOWO2_01_FULL_38_12]
MIAIFIVPVLIIFVLFLVGGGLSLYLTPSQWKQYTFWLAPWYGVIMLIGALILLSLFGLPIKTTTWPVTIILTLLTFREIALRKKRFVLSLTEDSLIALFVIGTIVLTTVSLFKYEKVLTTVTLGNSDAANYAISSDLVMNDVIYSKALLPVSSVGDMFYNIYRWGPPVISAYFSQLFGLKGYQIVYILQVVLFSLIPPLLVVLFKILYKASLVSIIFLLVITGLNANLLYILFHNFFGQILFWGIELFFIIFMLFYIESHNDNDQRSTYKLSTYEIIIGVSLGVMFMSYSEGTIFVCGPLLGYVLFRSLFYRELKKQILFLARIITVTFVISSVTAIYGFFNIFIRFTYKPTGKEIIGWLPFRDAIPFPNPYEILGFYSIHSFPPLPSVFAWILSLLAVLFVIYGFFKVKHRLFFMMFLVLYFYLYYWAYQRNNYFEYYRVVTYTIFLLLILFTIGFFEFLKKKKILLLGIALVLVLAEAFSGIKLVKRMNQSRLAAELSFISLSSLPRTYFTNEPIYAPTLLTEELGIWPTLWRTYFLYPQQLTYTSPLTSLSEYTNKVPDNKLVLFEKPVRWYPTINVLLREKVWKNEFYVLGRICNNQDCLLESNKDLTSIPFTREDFQDSLLIDGWSHKEDGHRWINAKEATMRLVVKNDPISKLHIEMLSLKDPQAMTLYVNEEKVDTVSIGTEWKEYISDIGLRQNEVINIRLELSNLNNPAGLGLSADARDLAIDIRKISLE